MAYTKEEIDALFKDICERIMNGERLRNILKESQYPSTDTFYRWLSDYDDKAKQYARAMEVRADLMFDQIFDIAEHTSEDHTPFTGSNVVNRDRLRIDAYKWALSKMNPKKYGDKIDHSSIDGTMSPKSTIVVKDQATADNVDKLINKK